MEEVRAENGEPSTGEEMRVDRGEFAVVFCSVTFSSSSSNNVSAECGFIIISMFVVSYQT